MGADNQIARQIIFFDGVCNLCNGAVNEIIEADKFGIFKFSSLQSDFAIRFLKEKYPNFKSIDSVMLYQNGNILVKSKAVMAIARSLSWPWRFLSFFTWLPSRFTDYLYDLVAKNRYAWFGKQPTCRIPTPELKSRFLDS